MLDDEILTIARSVASRFARFGSSDYDEATSVAALRMCAVRSKLDASRSEPERRAYLRRCAETAILDRLRRERAERRKIADYVDSGAAPGEAVDGEIDVRAALDDFRATTSLRDAVYWDSVVGGETAKEAASRLGVSVTTVRSRRKRLRKRFAAYLNERRDERTPSRF